MSAKVDYEVFMTKTVVPKKGDTRPGVRLYRAGHTFLSEDQSVEWRLKLTVEVDVVEEFDGRDWFAKTISWETWRPVPSTWDLIKTWLMYPAVPSNLPVAKVCK